MNKENIIQKINSIKKVLLGTTKSKILTIAVSTAVVGSGIGVATYSNINKADNGHSIEQSNAESNYSYSSEIMEEQLNQVKETEGLKVEDKVEPKEEIKTEDKEVKIPEKTISSAIQSERSSNEKPSNESSKPTEPNKPTKPSKPSGIDYDLSDRINATEGTDDGAAHAFKTGHEYMREQIYSIFLHKDITREKVVASNNKTMMYTGDYKVSKFDYYKEGDYINNGNFPGFEFSKDGSDTQYYRTIAYYNADKGEYEYYYYCLLFKEIK